MTSAARSPVQSSSARSRSSTVSTGSSNPPMADRRATRRWPTSAGSSRSQISARYHAIGTPAPAASCASSVVLPDPAGATTSASRYASRRASDISSRSRDNPTGAGARTLDGTGIVPFTSRETASGPCVLTLTGPIDVLRGAHPLGPAGSRRIVRDLARPVQPIAVEPRPAGPTIPGNARRPVAPRARRRRTA